MTAAVRQIEKRRHRIQDRNLSEQKLPISVEIPRGKSARSFGNLLQNLGGDRS